ncbi:EamA family transporter [Paenibacillus chitinolyticus]|uniref:EamA family transporter n=1 Tax=Paenibacillus chitinolyticus TaxID=79263 RepID=UPI00366CEBE7
MILFALLLVVLSGLTHSIWSLFAKSSRNKSVFLWSIAMIAVVVLLPPSIRELRTESLDSGAWLLLLASAVLQAVYGLLLSRTYQMGDLSQVYPIMRGTNTLLIPAFGVAFLGESLSVAGWIGLLCMILGFVMLSGLPTRKSATRGEGFSPAPVLMALGVGLCTTSYVLVDKINLQHVSPLTLLEVSNIGFAAGLTPAVLSSRKLSSEWKLNGKRIVLGAVLNTGSYLLFLLALAYAPVAHVSPVREIGTVFATLLGIFVLKEKQGTLRILSSLVITAGIMLIGFFG